MEYRKFKLSPGQQAPQGSTGVGVSDGYIVWSGEPGSFPEEIMSLEMTSEEILRFKKRDSLQLSVLEFRRRFTFDELVAIEVASETNPMVKVLKDDLALSSYIDVTDERTVAGVQYLVLQDLLTPERAAVILSL